MKKIITFLIITIFIILFIIETISFCITQTFINETNIPQLIKKNDTYSIVLNKIAPTKINEMYLNKLNSYDKTYYEIISNYLFSKLHNYELENSFSNSYKKIVLFLQNKENKNNIFIDISFIPKILNIDDIKLLLLKKENLNKLYNSLEICKENNKVNCKDQNLTFDEYSIYVENELNSNNTTINIPNNINLYENINQKNNLFEEFKQNYQFTQKIQFIILILEIIFILIIIFINYSFVYSYLKLLSIMFLTPTIFLLFFSLITYLNINMITNTIIINILKIEPKNVEMDIIKINLIDIINFIIQKISLISFSFLIIGLILLIISKKYKNNWREYEI